jgi:hypothetical protein
MPKVRKLNQYFDRSLYICQSFAPFVQIAYMEDEQDRDVAMLSALTIVSATLPNYLGRWRGHEYSPHLYTFFVGESGTSKSKATCLLPAVLDLHKEKLQRYEEELLEYREALSRCRGNEAASLVHPKRAKLLFSAKTTEAAFFKDFAASERDGGLLATSEAGMFGGSMGGEYGGGLSEALRQAFHHEFIDKSLSGDTEVTRHYFIENPRLAVLFAGTPGQLKRMMGGHVENGLLSRFMFYGTSLKDDRLSKEVDEMGRIIGELKQNIKQIYHDLEGREEPLIFHLPEELADRLLDFLEPFRARYARISRTYSGVIKRLCLSTFRMMMIFCAIRERQKLKTAAKIVCDETDFFMAKSIAECVVKHTIAVNQQFTTEKKVFRAEPLSILHSMPDPFAYSDFVRLAESEGVTERTGKNWMKTLIEKNLIEKGGDGRYRKV